MFPRLWRSNQIILSAISGGSLEKLTRAVTGAPFAFWDFGFFSFARGGEVLRVFWVCSGFFGGVPGFLRDVPGFLAGVPGFWQVVRVFWDVPGFSGVSECSVMFRCSGVPCSGVPGSTTCRPLVLSNSHCVIMNQISMDARPSSIKWRVQFISAAKFPSRLVQVPLFNSVSAMWGYSEQS